MTECDELAEVLAKHVKQPIHTMAEARAFLVAFLPDESEQLLDNVAESLLQVLRAQERAS